MSWQERVGQGKPGQGRAGQSRAEQSRAEQSRGGGCDLIQCGGSSAVEAHGVPQGLQHLKGDIQQVLVEEVHHVLTQAVAPLQCTAGPPAKEQGEKRLSEPHLAVVLLLHLHAGQTPHGFSLCSVPALPRCALDLPLLCGQMG